MCPYNTNSPHDFRTNSQFTSRRIFSAFFRFGFFPFSLVISNRCLVSHSIQNLQSRMLTNFSSISPHFMSFLIALPKIRPNYYFHSQSSSFLFVPTPPSIPSPQSPSNPAVIVHNAVAKAIAHVVVTVKILTVKPTTVQTLALVVVVLMALTVLLLVLQRMNHNNNNNNNNVLITKSNALSKTQKVGKTSQPQLQLKLLKRNNLNQQLHLKEPVVHLLDLIQTKNQKLKNSNQSDWLNNQLQLLQSPHQLQ